jgi:hypothetical protein
LLVIPAKAGSAFPQREALVIQRLCPACNL